MNEEQKRKFKIMCKHDFKPATDLPSNQFRCVKCMAAGIMDSIQTQNLTAKQESIIREKHRINVIKQYN